MQNRLQCKTGTDPEILWNLRDWAPLWNEEMYLLCCFEIKRGTPFSFTKYQTLQNTLKHLMKRTLPFWRQIEKTFRVRSCDPRLSTIKTFPILEASRPSLRTLTRDLNFQDLFAKKDDFLDILGRVVDFVANLQICRAAAAAQSANLFLFFMNSPKFPISWISCLCLSWISPQIFQLMILVFIFFSKIPRISTLMNCLAFKPNSMHIQLQYSKHKKAKLHWTKQAYKMSTQFSYNLLSIWL